MFTDKNVLLSNSTKNLNVKMLGMNTFLKHYKKYCNIYIFFFTEVIPFELVNNKVYYLQDTSILSYSYKVLYISSH